MPERLMLVDSDIFIILAAAGVLETAASLLEFEPEDIRRLPALENQLTRGRAFRKNYPRQIRQAALRACSCIRPIEQRPSDPRTLDQLAAVSDIDLGEALLYALAAERPAYILASGDKRAMRALARDTRLKNIRDALAGRLLCLEAAVAMLVRRGDITALAKAFAPLCSVNAVLRVAFSRGAATTTKQCLQALRTYLEELESEVGSDLLLIPRGKGHGSKEN